MKRITALLLAVVMLFALTACKEEPDTSLEQPVETVIPEVPEEPVEPEIKYFSPLTGEEIDENTAYTRPVALTVNNLKKATPQSGMTNADMYFEIPAEGGINRILTVFQDYDGVKEIGTVRSARAYFVDWAVPLDAVFIHYGGSPSFYTLKKQKRFDECDGINGTVEKALFWRDAERKKKAGTEHSVMTSGEKLTNGLKSLGIRSTVDTPYEPFFLFNKEAVASGDIPANKVSLKFSYYITSEFEYNEATGLYFRSQYGQPHKDKTTNAQLSVTNVVYLKTSISAISGDDAGRIDVKTTGSGSGYYISKGKAQEIKWSKKDLSSPLKLYDLNGNELAINKGKTWFMINNTNIVME